ncbi:unnamed protein product [Moneuplotes crassus]|uniref:Uncharacterized protein n=1 Tax=Euplotes crassus TaxID=5936 RepID=A0AAD1UUU9_EUPCR|nr:unnamed protein product [Moneuplotes crassus]
MCVFCSLWQLNHGICCLLRFWNAHPVNFIIFGVCVHVAIRYEVFSFDDDPCAVLCATLDHLTFLNSFVKVNTFGQRGSTFMTIALTQISFFVFRYFKYFIRVYPTSSGLVKVMLSASLASSWCSFTTVRLFCLFCFFWLFCAENCSFCVWGSSSGLLTLPYGNKGSVAVDTYSDDNLYEILSSPNKSDRSWSFSCDLRTEFCFSRDSTSSLSLEFSVSTLMTYLK